MQIGETGRSIAKILKPWWAPVLGSIILGWVTGCQTPAPAKLSAKDLEPETSVTVREGDLLRISFPGAPNLDTRQQVRRDGIISLPLAGEVKAAGKTPADLEKEIAGLYEPQLLNKEVTVTLESSSFPVFVTGAVLRPGKILSDRPITALEAIMEAGGFDFSRAKVKGVVVVRHEEGRVKNFTLNLKRAFQGKEIEPFFLKPSDIVYVPERFSFF